MKTNKIVVVGMLLLGTFLSQSQEIVNPYPDTLKVKTDSQIEVAFSFYRMSDKEKYLTDDLWKSVLSVMESAVESSVYQEGIVVSYQKVKKGEDEVARVKVDELQDKAEVFTIDKDGMKEVYSDRIDFVIYQPKVSISFSLDDLTDLDEIKELSLESVWEQIDQKFENEGTRNLYNGVGVFKYGRANLEGIVGAPTAVDNIELSAGLGFGFYRDRFAPDMNFRLAVHFPDRLGNDDLKFGFIYSQQYFYNQKADESFDLDVNGFLSGFVSSQIGSDREIGLAIGMLVRKEGSFYEGNTFKVTGFNRKITRVSFSPELIFTNDFKDIIPGIKFGLSF